MPLFLNLPKVRSRTIAADCDFKFNVHFVPEAEVNPGILNGSYRESWPSDFITQGPLSALRRPSKNLGGWQSSARSGRSIFELLSRRTGRSGSKYSIKWP